MLLSFLNYDEDGSVDAEKSQIIPLVDGGTEGFKGMSLLSMYMSLKIHQTRLLYCFSQLILYVSGPLSHKLLKATLE